MDNQKAFKGFRLLMMSSYFGLLILLTLWITVLESDHVLPIALLLILAVGPLLLILRGLLHARPKTSAWAIFLSFPYFAHGIGEWVSTKGNTLLGSIETLLSTGLFLGAMLSVRYWARMRSDQKEAATIQAEPRSGGD